MSILFFSSSLLSLQVLEYSSSAPLGVPLRLFACRRGLGSGTHLIKSPQEDESVGARYGFVFFQTIRMLANEFVFFGAGKIPSPLNW